MELEKGITRTGEGFGGVRWNILGQTYFPKAVCDSAFAFEAIAEDPFERLLKKNQSLRKPGFKAALGGAR